MPKDIEMTQPRAMVTYSESNQWTSGICDCFQDLPQCCLAFWCFPCFTCITAKKAGECLCLPLLDYHGCIPPITTAIRGSVRRRYGIEGTIFKDVLYSTCCLPCTWCQVAREMKTRK